MTDPFGPGDETPPGMPRWLRMSLIALAAAAVLLIVLSLLGVGPSHGPELH